MENRWIKVLLLVFMALYVISPVDACPGPIDDLIVMMLTFAAQRRLGIPGKADAAKTVDVVETIDIDD